MTERKSLESERAELVAIADQIDVFIKYGTNAIFEPDDAKKIASALRRLAAQDQKPYGWLIDRKIEPVFFTRCEIAANEYAGRGVNTTPLYLSPPPAAGWDEAIEAALVELANMPMKDESHTSTLLDARKVIAALRHNAPPDSGAGKSAPLPDSSLPSGESDLSVMSDYGGADAINDPIERIVADGLMYAGVSFSHESSSPGQRLDFSLADGVMIECKQFHTSRISDQLAPFSDVILVQGRKAASWLKGILSGGAVPDHGGADAGVGEGWTSRKCPHCKGTGENLSAYIVDDFTRCNHCGGTGDEYAALSKPAPVAANASAEARLREALVQIQTVCTDRHDEALQFVASVVSRALYPHASDCDKQEER